jgi:hypothetical protein
VGHLVHGASDQLAVGVGSQGVDGGAGLVEELAGAGGIAEAAVVVGEAEVQGGEETPHL